MPLFRLAPTAPAPHQHHILRRGPIDWALETTKSNLRWGVRHALPKIALRRALREGRPAARLVFDTTGTTIDELVPLLDELREVGPTFRGPISTITVDHAVVREALTSSDFESDVFGRTSGPLGQVLRWSLSSYLHPVFAPSLLAVDGPDHARYRKLVTRVFSAKAVEQLRERTVQIADELLDSLAERAARGETVDLVEEYCTLLPVTVICEILGVSASDRDLVLKFGNGAAPSIDIGLSFRAHHRVERNLEEFDTWLGQHLDYLRRNPGDNLLSQLVAARDDDQIGLSEAELKSIAGLVLAAGFETTVNLLSNGISLLRNTPGQLTILQENPDLWPNAVEEVLRFDPPVLLTVRVARAEATMGGVDLARGDVIVTVLAGANRDAQVFDDPHRFDVTRPNARDHISFSTGRHYCLGASLARMEGTVGLQRLFERFDQVELLPGATRRSTRILRGFEYLPARLSAE